MENITIVESFTLPSKGKIYRQGVSEDFRLRSMTTEDEMKRLSPSNLPYKLIADMIDDCVLDNIGISAYDMHLGDYQYMLHRLRVVTYGSDYKVTTTCPYCGNLDTYSVNLDDLDVETYDSEVFAKWSKLTLPVSKKVVELNYQTPRMLDNIAKRKREDKERNPQSTIDNSLLYSVCELIKTLDGTVYDPIRLEQIVRKFSMADTNKILQYGMKLNQSIGLKAQIVHTCSNCGETGRLPFRVTGEFFGPSED